MPASGSLATTKRMAIIINRPVVSVTVKIPAGKNHLKIDCLQIGRQISIKNACGNGWMGKIGENWQIFVNLQDARIRLTNPSIYGWNLIKGNKIETRGLMALTAGIFNQSGELFGRKQHFWFNKYI
jgi:hypothetical protein